MNIAALPWREDLPLKYSVIVAKDQCGYVLVRHHQCNTWEIPGGHIEAGETALAAAKRELAEETGATDFSIEPIGVYSVTVNEQTTYGGLFLAQISQFSGSLEHEIAEVKSFASMPDQLTYPKIQSVLFDYVQRLIAGQVEIQ
ncbi:NUDIX hydrolase [Salinibius halmophilus]|uniref:NUDIX hydrolase n=1 Tax=Salinibius halmophilus TaxID=1853216 RepID=UPI000E670550|nr:NUDIX domain-containing protein [Salinibius halmophilus]